ncbi:MAG: hypothetical protein SCK57_00060 [Bacillota bacterium]|nr:hypothetical protein [Bacillota bacterium]MDW7676034.1 hypothetical protein [Bacillota bacterium]
MIEIREIKPGEEVLLMDFFREQPNTKPLLIETDDRIFLFWDHFRLDGVMILRPLSEKICVLIALETARDHGSVQDGLMRTAFNALNKHTVSWVLADTEQVEKLVALKEHFKPLDQHQDIRSLLEGIGQLLTGHDWLAVSTGVIYQGSCNEGTDAQ